MLHIAVMIAALSVSAEPPRVTPNHLPSWFPQGYEAREVRALNYDQSTFNLLNGKPHSDFDRKDFRGRHYHARLFAPASEGGQKAWNGPKKFAELEAALKKLGFTRDWYTSRPEDNSQHIEATFKRGGANPAYVSAQFSATGDHGTNELDILEVGSNPDSITLQPPGKTQEKVDDKAEFPYLKGLPFMRFLGTTHDASPLDVFTSQHSDQEPRGTGSEKKEYKDDTDTLSSIAFADVYDTALKKAGWTITRELENEGSLYAHFDKNNRDIWAYVRFGEHPAFIVSDVGTDLQAALRKSCTAAVYGVNFDFNKDTLRPDAEPALNQILALFKAEPSLKAEIGGHTDNVGKPDYNQQLSERRAGAVKKWLVARGIADARLTTHGYGDTQPVVPNSNDENRARNRRVEIKKSGCK